MAKLLIILSFIFLTTVGLATELSDKSNPNKKEVISETTKIDPSINNSEDEEMRIYEKRRTMLTWHRYTGWATIGLMAATIATAPEGDEDVSTHKFFGGLTGLTYLTSASLAIFSPPSYGMQSTNITIHKTLAWFHVPAFALTVFSGIQAANDDESSIGKIHKPLAGITALLIASSAVLSTDWSMNLIPESGEKYTLVFSRTF